MDEVLNPMSPLSPLHPVNQYAGCECCRARPRAAREGDEVIGIFVVAFIVLAWMFFAVMMWRDATRKPPEKRDDGMDWVYR